jgi:flagellar biosynthetic protein FliR
VVFARVTGVFVFNPILGRTTVPMRIRVMMSLVMTMAMLSSMNDVTGYIPSSIPGFVGVLVLEAALGFVFGFIVNMFLTAIIFAGKIIDNQMTLALAETMDPGSGANMPISANWFYNLFVLYFFVIGGHLIYINLFAISYSVIPIGFNISLEWFSLSRDLVMFFQNIMTLAVKMAMPIIAAQMILQVSVGVLKKVVPQIQLLVINIQMKLLMGFFILLAILVPMSNFLQNLMDIMFDNLFGTLYRLE